ncbi:MAG: VOC family protein [Bacteroidota bacterium]
MSLQPFHLAIPVTDIDKARHFYGGVLRLEEGRSSDHWIDYNFFGHQLVVHKVDAKTDDASNNPVDGKSVPVPHFGVVLEWEHWQEFAEYLGSREEIAFEIEPYQRFAGQVGEQATLFFYDPFGNAMEFKAFKDPSQLFAK